MFIGLKSYILNNMLKKPKVVILALCPSVESMLRLPMRLLMGGHSLSFSLPLWSVGLYVACRIEWARRTSRTGLIRSALVLGRRSGRMGRHKILGRSKGQIIIKREKFCGCKMSSVNI